MQLHKVMNLITDRLYIIFRSGSHCFSTPVYYSFRKLVNCHGPSASEASWSPVSACEVFWLRWQTVKYRDPSVYQ